MKKIISLFLRNEDHFVRNELTPGAEWVQGGAGVATRKLDGTCCLVKDGKLYKRYDAKKTAPEGFIPAQEPKDGHWPGWVPITLNDYWHKAAWDLLTERIEGATLELIGPKVQSNPEKAPFHMLQYHHLAEVFPDCPRDFDAIKAWLADKDMEGVVWHHPDGRMIKIKKRDFGLKR